MEFRIHIYGFLETPEKRQKPVQSRTGRGTGDAPGTRPLGHPQDTPPWASSGHVPQDTPPGCPQDTSLRTHPQDVLRTRPLGRPQDTSPRTRPLDAPRTRPQDVLRTRSLGHLQDTSLRTSPEHASQVTCPEDTPRRPPAVPDRSNKDLSPAGVPAVSARWLSPWKRAPEGGGRKVSPK